MKPQKRCAYCHGLFSPYPARYRRQRACPKPQCQRQRRRDTNRTYRLKNPYDADYRRDVKKRWRQVHGRAYMRAYREKRPDYVKTNRRHQYRRDGKKQNLVKKDVWTSLRTGNIVRIRVLEESCKERLMRLLPSMKNRVSDGLVK
jgi:hypothetical protein